MEFPECCPKWECEEGAKVVYVGSGSKGPKEGEAPEPSEATAAAATAATET
jgi:hypothetical protein